MDDSLCCHTPVVLCGQDEGILFLTRHKLIYLLSGKACVDPDLPDGNNPDQEQDDRALAHHRQDVMNKSWVS